MNPQPTTDLFAWDSDDELTSGSAPSACTGDGAVPPARDSGRILRTERVEAELRDCQRDEAFGGRSTLIPEFDPAAYASQVLGDDPSRTIVVPREELARLLAACRMSPANDDAEALDSLEGLLIEEVALATG